MKLDDRMWIKLCSCRAAIAPDFDETLESDLVRSHVFLCMFAYYLEWHIRQALASIFSEEHNRLGKLITKLNSVTPARGSSAKECKVATLCTVDDYPLHSFRTLLSDLATFTLNTVTTLKSDTFPMLATSTFKANVFTLLGIKIADVNVGSSS